MGYSQSTGPRFRAEDSFGLAVAIVLHGALVALLLLQPVRDEVLAIPERMSVSLVSEVSLESTAPQLVEESRAAIAPVLSDEIQPEIAEPEPQTEAPVEPQPAPVRVTRGQNSSITAPRSQRRPRNPPAQRARTTPNRPQSGSRIGEDFLPPGAGSSTETEETAPPAAQFGRRERVALSSAITRQLRRHWTAPQGVDAELLVSVVSWRLNPDGSLAGRPRCQTRAGGITDSNRPQAPLHCERAIRAVQLAAPFNLPEQFYNRWKELEWEFDRRL